MYTIEEKAYTWSLTYRKLKSGDIVPNQGKRSMLVTQGVYIIDHVSSGWFIIGQSRTVSAEVDKQLALLQAGRHPNRKLQSQYSCPNDFSCMDLKFIEIPIHSTKDCKRIEAQIRASNTTGYCLLN
ncbi:putative homing endonuclease [Pseudomonas phage D6]|nr:putative homing endonuclease [Pseudomonas phage D6]